MNSFDDISQISDVHNVSGISKSGSRVGWRADTLPNLLEHRSAVHNASKNAYQGSSAAEKTAKRFTSCEETITELYKNNMILNCVREATSGESKVLPATVTEKLRGLSSIHELNKYMRLPSVSQDGQREESSVLGTTDLPMYESSYEERLDVKCCVEALLRERIHEFTIRYNGLGGSTKDIISREKMFGPKGARMPCAGEKIEKLFFRYAADLSRLKDLMSLWNKLKYGDMNDINLENASHLLVQAQVAELRAKIAKLSCTIRMFKETPATIAAHKILGAILDDKLHRLIAEIREKQELKRRYQNSKKSEFDDAVKNYTDLCKAIEKKREILRKLCAE